MDPDLGFPGIVPIVKRLLYIIASPILFILKQFKTLFLWTVSMMNHNYNQSDNSTLRGFTKYLPNSRRGNTYHDNGVSSAGTPVPPMLLRDRSQGHGTFIPEIEAAWHYETDLDALKKTITVLQDEVRRLESEVKSLQQGQDFRSYYAEAGTPHDKLQRQLRNLRQEIIAWSRVTQRDLLNVAAVDEELEKVLGLEKTRELINNKDLCQEVPITTSDIFAAIASNIIVEQAVLNPLISCTSEFRNAMNSKVYEMMSSDRSSRAVNQKAAKMWQSACLKMYDLSDEFGSEHEKKAAREQSIDDITSMVFKALEIGFNDQAHQPKLRNSISLAVDIGKTLGQSLSGLVPMNKGWLQEYVDADGYISASTLGSRIEPRYPPDGGKTIIKGKVALVLFPGLLKYGSDDGEHWDSWTVWTPAKVHLMDEQIEDTPQEAPDKYAYQPPAKIARSDHGMERYGGQGIAPKERSITQSNCRGSRMRDKPPSGQDYHPFS
ncbi:hypothetical protein FPANT_13803 [Fusarium pseudoanthophilum]|uniref:Uncharacterized protein n=1 Tax=Fusarium pseudoanthophilum TaxID=48495 RepID=A0A8H5NMH3_9HYPO|nr:hypothetical protein FPANT_13803 [Fusarium pseudoanthophilum]